MKYKVTFMVEDNEKFALTREELPYALKNVWGGVAANMNSELSKYKFNCYVESVKIMEE